MHNPQDTYTRTGHSLLSTMGHWLEEHKMKREILFGSLIILALIAFELFNFSTTDFALTDLLGDLRFAGLRWATILAVAFCGMDFAGIARLFSPNSPLTRPSFGRRAATGQRAEPVEVWYLLGAWFLAATMNAVLTWWGVSLALVSHANLGNEILSRQQLLSGVPIFVAVLVWLIRILLIGTFSMAGDRLFAFADSARSDARTRPFQPARVIGEMEDAPPARTPDRVPAPGRPAPVQLRPISSQPERNPDPPASVRPRPAVPAPAPTPEPRPFRPSPKPAPAVPTGPNGNDKEFLLTLPSLPTLKRASD